MSKKRYPRYWSFVESTSRGRREATKEKLYKNLISKRNRWKKEYPDIDDIDWFIIKFLGTACIYCGKILTAENIGVDHKFPRQRGGGDYQENLHIVCMLCNKRKGILTHEEFLELNMLIGCWSEKPRKYILSQLLMQSWSKWN